jgi:hypothetical protein
VALTTHPHLAPRLRKEYGYTSMMKSRRMRWTGHVARMGEGERCVWVSVEKPEVKRPLGRPRVRWENNIKANL